VTLGIGPADWPQPEVEGGSDSRALGRTLMEAHPSPGLDWGVVSVLARGYGLSPLLYFRLCERSSAGAGEEEGACVPEDVVELLRKAIAEANPLGLCSAKLAGGSLWAA
jgi:hypothetical protein